MQRQQLAKELRAELFIRSRRNFLPTPAGRLARYARAVPAQVRARYPVAEIPGTVPTTEQIVRGLLERRFDLGLITLPCDTSGLTTWPLLEEEMLVLKPSSAGTRSARAEPSFSDISYPEETFAAPSGSGHFDSGTAQNFGWRSEYNH